MKKLLTTIAIVIAIFMSNAQAQVTTTNTNSTNGDILINRTNLYKANLKLTKTGGTPDQCSNYPNCPIYPMLLVESDLEGSSMYTVLSATHMGRVGVGTSLPTGIFNVHNIEGYNHKTAIFSAPSSSYTRSIFFVNNLNSASYNDLSVQSDQGIFWTDGASSSMNSTSGFVIAPWAGSSAGIKITSDGNIGFGVSDPLAKFHLHDGAFIITNSSNAVNFRVGSDGFVRAREVRVDVATIVPDYVFQPGYKLMTLNEVEKYIKENKHLPGIPSAAEFEAEGGIDLGEMQLKMLEKIEELTLHLIEMKKQNEALQNRVNSLENK